MKKLFTVAAVSLLSLSSAAFAETAAENEADIKADVRAIQKDDAAIAKQDNNLAANRAEKAKAKAEGDVATQAGASVKIGANHTAKGVKKAERKVDEKVLEHDMEDRKKY